jgi:hypothetical protein
VLKLTDGLGREVMNSNISQVTGGMVKNIDASFLSQGIYHLTIKDKNGSMSSAKVLLQ